MITFVLLSSMYVVHGKVVTFVDDRCGSACDEWLQMVSVSEQLRPDVPFEVVHVGDSEFSKYVDLFSDRHNTFTIALPKTIWMDERNIAEYKYDMTKKHLLRWVDDAIEGHFDLVRKVSTLSEVKHLEKSDCFVEYLGPTKPNALSHKARAYPSVIFMWLQTGVDDAKMEIRGDNVSFVKCLDSVSVLENNDLSDLRFRLYPSVVTPSMLSQLDLDWSYELHIVSDGVLPVGWNAFARAHASTLFIQLHPDDTDECPGVWFYRGADVYHYPSLGVGVQFWFNSVVNGSAVPLRRDARSGSPLMVLDDVNLDDLTSLSSDTYVCTCQPELCRFPARCVSYLSEHRDLSIDRMYHFVNGTIISNEPCVMSEL